MLVLTRKPQEKFFIQLPNGDQIEVVVLSIHAGKARLGIDCPREYKIWREELMQGVANASDSKHPTR